MRALQRLRIVRSALRYFPVNERSGTLKTTCAAFAVFLAASIAYSQTPPSDAPAPDGEETPPSLEETLAKALDGDAEAQTLIASMYEERGSHEDAVRWYSKAAKQGRPDAQFKLGFYHARGSGGLKKDMEAAANWFQKAAGKDQVGAQYNLAVCYENGLGVPQNNALALGWYRQAADRGETFAQKAVGVHYEKGRAVKQDKIEACAWYLLSASRNNPEAKKLLKNLAPSLKPEESKKAQQRAHELSARIYQAPLGAANTTAAKPPKKGPTKDFLE